MKQNLLSDFRDIYAGPWPRAISFLLLLVFGGPLVGALITGEPISPKLFVASGFVAVTVFITGVWVKRRYPRSEEGE